MICDICEEDFDVELNPAALFFSHPDELNRPTKYHVCQNCEHLVLDLINRKDSTTRSADK